MDNHWKLVKVSRIYVGDTSNVMVTSWEDHQRRIECVPDGDCIAVKEFVKQEPPMVISKQPTHEEMLVKLSYDIRNGGGTAELQKAVLYLLQSAIIPPEK